MTDCCFIALSGKMSIAILSLSLAGIGVFSWAGTNEIKRYKRIIALHNLESAINQNADIGDELEADEEGYIKLYLAFRWGHGTWWPNIYNNSENIEEEYHYDDETIVITLTKDEVVEIINTTIYDFQKEMRSIALTTKNDCLKMQRILSDYMLKNDIIPDGVDVDTDGYPIQDLEIFYRFPYMSPENERSVHVSQLLQK